MKNHDYIFDQIDRYINSEMTDDEVRIFEEELKKNTSIKEELSLHQTGNELVFLNKLHKIPALIEKQRKKRKAKKITLVAVLIISIILFLFTILVINFNETKPAKPQEKEPVKKLDSPNNKLIKKSTNKPEGQKPSSIKQINKPVNKKDKTLKKEASFDSITNLNIPQKTLQNPNNTNPKKEEALKISTELKNTKNHLDTNKNQTLQIITKKDDCENITNKWKIITRASCRGSENGTISITGFKETPNSRIIIKDSLGLLQEQESLSPGEYIVILIKDKCEVSKNTVINNVLCLESDYILSIYNPTLLINYLPENSKVSITNKTGELYYQTTVNDFFEWDGKDYNGNIVNNYYLLTIELENGEIYNASLTIAK